MQVSDRQDSLTAIALDGRFLRRLVWLNGLVPALLLGWDALHQTLGVDAVNYAIRTTGILGLVFLVLTLVVTPLRKVVGVPLFVVVRRSLGLYAFFYLATHFLLFFVLDRQGNVGSTWHEIITRRYLTIGTVALILLVPLAVTSTDGKIRRLGAKRWKALHRLVYLILVLGCIHYILLVKADVRQPLAFAGAAGLLLGYRAYDALKERRRSRTPPAALGRWSGELAVVEATQETADVRTLRLAATDGGALPFTFEPGQYLAVVLPIDGTDVRRSYSISSSASETRFCEITVKRKEGGVGSAYIHRIERGARIRASGPSGRFVFDGSGAHAVTLVGGGVGITPLMSMARSLVDRGFSGEIQLLLSMKTEADIVFRDELRRLAERAPNVHVTISLTQEASDGWTGRRGKIDRAMLVDILGEAPRGPVYLCGPDGMMKSLRDTFVALGVPEREVFIEAFVAATAEVEDADPQPGRTYSVVFERSGQTIAMPRRLTLLEAGEGAGLDLAYECRAGFCGQCKVKLSSGSVTMASEDALDPSDRAEGVILACQARPTSDLVVDA